MLDAIRVFQRTAIFPHRGRRSVGLVAAHEGQRSADRHGRARARVTALRAARRELVAKYGTPRCGPPLREAGLRRHRLRQARAGSSSATAPISTSCSCTTRAARSRRPTAVPPLDNERFFSRLVQRLIHFLTIQTSSGRLYEVDTRLRPSGRSGLARHEPRGLRHYQTQRGLGLGAPGAAAQPSARGLARRSARAFERIRREVLVAHVDRTQAQGRGGQDARAACARSCRSAKPGSFDIKQDPAASRTSSSSSTTGCSRTRRSYPELVEFPDNIRQLEALERVGLVPAERCAAPQRGLSRAAAARARARAGRRRARRARPTSSRRVRACRRRRLARGVRATSSGELRSAPRV